MSYSSYELGYILAAEGPQEALVYEGMEYYLGDWDMQIVVSMKSGASRAGTNPSRRNEGILCTWVLRCLTPVTLTAINPEIWHALRRKGNSAPFHLTFAWSIAPIPRAQQMYATRASPLSVDPSKICITSLTPHRYAGLCAILYLVPLRNRQNMLGRLPRGLQGPPGFIVTAVAKCISAPLGHVPPAD